MCNGCATCVAAATAAANGNAATLQGAKTNHGRPVHGGDAGRKADIAAARLDANVQRVWDNLYSQTLNRLKRTCPN